MAYSSALQVYQTALVESDTAAATLLEVIMPLSGQIEEFGIVITEDVAAQTQDWVLSLSTAPDLAGTDTEKVTINVGNGVTKYSGDGVRAGAVLLTADADIDVGDVVLGKRSLLPVKFTAGQSVSIKTKTASTGVGGAGYAFFAVRFSGVNLEASNVWVQTE